MAYLGVDLTQTTTFDDYSPLPNGEYSVIITDSKITETRSGEKQLQFTYKVTDGQYAGRLVFDNFSLWSSNPKAIEVAQRRLKTITVAVNLPGSRINDSSELHGKYMTVRLATREFEGKQYQDVRSYKPNPGYTPAPGAMPPPQAAPSAPKAKMPWE